MKGLNCKLLVLFIFLLTSSVAKGQFYYSPNFSVGFKGGATVSQRTFSPDVPQSYIVGSMFGVSARYIEESLFGLVAELNFEQRGWKENFDGEPYSYERRLSYIQIPVFTHIYFGNDRIKGFFNLGPEIGFLIGDSYKSSFDIYTIDSDPDFPSLEHSTEQYTEPLTGKVDYGISLGGGMEVFMSKRNSLQLEGRFYYGLGNIFGNSKS
ncbi:MAG: porin family protein, partial [Bacteroidales bacterium]